MQKRFIPILILAAMVILVAQGSLWGQDNRSKWLKGSDNKPIDIASDRLDAYREKDLVQFSGNVVATQGERVIKSDTLEPRYSSPSPPGPPPVGPSSISSSGIDS